MRPQCFCSGTRVSFYEENRLMKVKMCFVAVATTCLMLAGTARAAVIVSEVNPSGSGNAPYAADWFELTNTGASAVNISNWRMDDNSASFGSSVALLGVPSINPGQSVVFIEGDGSNIPAFETAWFGANVPAGFTIGSYSGSGVGLSTGGDSVNIYTPNGGGSLITGVDFPGATNGITFDNAAGLTGSISALSVLGVNGAFASLGSPQEIGSPGTITGVPEPASVVLAGLGISLLVAGGLRHRK
jgi:hypothetical protein